jgi:hypothetical protein
MNIKPLGIQVHESWAKTMIEEMGYHRRDPKSI